MGGPQLSRVALAVPGLVGDSARNPQKIGYYRTVYSPARLEFGIDIGLRFDLQETAYT